MLLTTGHEQVAVPALGASAVSVMVKVSPTIQDLSDGLPITLSPGDSTNGPNMAAAAHNAPRLAVMLIDTKPPGIGLGRMTEVPSEVSIPEPAAGMQVKPARLSTVAGGVESSSSTTTGAGAGASGNTLRPQLQMTPHHRVQQ